VGTAAQLVKRILVGKPIPSHEEHKTRLSKVVALPVFSSDAISSTAYATEEILIVLVGAGVGVSLLHLSIWIAFAVAGLLAIVALSYQQTIYAYPSGGGSYIVSTENLGKLPGMIAASSLMIDYVMTVSVSVASGVAAVTSAFPGLFAYRLFISLAVVALVALANLRGLRESGQIFAIPTYAFILLCGGLVVVGSIRWLTGGLHALPVAQVTQQTQLTSIALVFLVLRAFSGGCTAMTGTEAISNGVPAFKSPESRNAAVTLGIMAIILGVFLVGVTHLAQVLHLVPLTTDTVLSQIGRAVYGSGFFYYALQVATMAILFLGANTSFADFPRLSSILARDGLMPRQFMNRGDKLAFSNGIIGLAVLAMIILAVFNAATHKMIPLYAVGVFISFTLSQAGMVVHWFKLKTDGWQRRAVMNAFGAVLTGVVSLVVLATKFTQGAYIVLAAGIVMVLIFRYIKSHYSKVARFLEPQSPERLERLGRVAISRPRTTVVLFVAQVNELTARALSLGMGLSPDDFHAATIAGDPGSLARLQRTWADMEIEVPLIVVDSPYREFTGPAVDYVRSLKPGPHHTVTVIIPEFVVEHWWDNFLHNQNALRLKAALLGVPWVVVISIPFHIGAPDAEEIYPSAPGGLVD
jgi:amino acid transporter